MTKKQQKQRDLLIERAYHETCSGIQSNIMDISLVFAHGKKLIDSGANYETLKNGIRSFVETIRQN